MSAHTPGPWTLDTVTTSCGICHKVGPFPRKEGKYGHACIYVDYPGTGKIEGELLANARLIAAAPDLLDAAEEALEAIADGDVQSARNALRAAIAKATGNSS